MCLYIFPILSILGDQDYRKWKNQEGKIMEARFVKFNKEKVEIKRKDGFTFTILPTAFSQEDQEYLTELKKRTDSRGYLWDSTSAKFELVSKKWLDSPEGSSTRVYYQFKQEKVDLDNDGKYDGMRVAIKKNYQKHHSRPKAWTVTNEGILVLRENILGIREGTYKFNFDTKRFVKLKGSGPLFLRSAGI